MQEEFPQICGKGQEVMVELEEEEDIDIIQEVHEEEMEKENTLKRKLGDISMEQIDDIYEEIKRSKVQYDLLRVSCMKSFQHSFLSIDIFSIFAWNHSMTLYNIVY